MQGRGSLYGRGLITTALESSVELSLEKVSEARVFHERQFFAFHDEVEIPLTEMLVIFQQPNKPSCLQVVIHKKRGELGDA